MPLSACIKSAIHTVCFFNVGSLLISLFSVLVMLWSLVAITSVREEFSVNIEMNHFVRNICWASCMPSVISCYQVHAKNADTHIPICGAPLLI